MALQDIPGSTGRNHIRWAPEHQIRGPANTAAGEAQEDTGKK